MNLLSVHLARAIWLFPLADLNPRGKAVNHVGVPAIVDRYGFMGHPTGADLLKAGAENKPVEFLNGVYQPHGRDAVVIDLRIYRDGIIADTKSSTSDSESFIEDLLTWSSEQFGLLSPDGIVQAKRYVSELYVTTDRLLSTLNPKLLEFSKRLSAEVKGRSLQFECGALGFWPDQEDPTKPAPFRFERAENVSFARKRYWSIAPLETEIHLTYLQSLESILSE